jgi:hypothetical protein
MRRLRCTGGGAAVLSTNRQCNAARLAHPYRLCRGRRQIDLPAAHKGAAIIDAYGDTPVMTDQGCRTPTCDAPPSLPRNSAVHRSRCVIRCPRRTQLSRSSFRAFRLRVACSIFFTASSWSRLQPCHLQPDHVHGASGMAGRVALRSAPLVSRSIEPCRCR